MPIHHWLRTAPTFHLHPKLQPQGPRTFRLQVKEVAGIQDAAINRTPEFGLRP